MLENFHPISHSPFYPGEQCFAIHGFNVSLSGTGDFVLNPSLEATVDASVPVVERVLPTRGRPSRVQLVEIQFSRPVQGVDASIFSTLGPCDSPGRSFPGQFLFTHFPRPRRVR